MVTLDQIAREAGVSPATVANVLKGRNKETWPSAVKRAQEIRDIAARLGYQPNELARAVATGKSHTLGILLESHVQESLGLTMVGALDEAARHNYSTKVMYLPDDATEEDARRVVQRCLTWRLDGLLILGSAERHVEMFEVEMRRMDCLLAFVGNMPSEGAIGAYSDDTSGWRLAVKHLVELGHRRIAHLGARPNSRLARNRHDLCLQVLREFDIPVTEKSSTYAAWFNFSDVEQGIERLLAVPEPPTAILCPSDYAAMNALRVLEQRGLRVPQDCSVVGFGGVLASQLSNPPITTVKQPHEEVARHAVRQLLEQVKSNYKNGKSSPSPQPFKLTSGFELIVRESTAPPPSV